MSSKSESAKAASVTWQFCEAEVYWQAIVNVCTHIRIRMAIPKKGAIEGEEKEIEIKSPNQECQ